MDFRKKQNRSETNHSTVEWSKRRWIFDRSKKILKENRRTKLILSGRCAWNNCKRNMIQRRSMVLFVMNADHHGLKGIFARRHEMIVAKNDIKDNDKIRIFRTYWNRNWSCGQPMNQSSTTFQIKTRKNENDLICSCNNKDTLFKIIFERNLSDWTSCCVDKITDDVVVWKKSHASFMI